jgi:hypothetical protein
VESEKGYETRVREMFKICPRFLVVSYLERGVDLANVRKLINPDLDRPISYNSYKYFVQHDPELATAWQAQKSGRKN